MPHFSEALQCRVKMEKLLYNMIDEHKSTYDPENPRDIIDEYFKERDRRRSKGDPTAEYFTGKKFLQFNKCILISVSVVLDSFLEPFFI